MPLNLLLAWWNLIYIVPFAMALCYLGLFVFTGITFGDPDVDADLDADATVHVQAHVGIEHDAELDADHDAEFDQDVDGDSECDAEAQGGGAIMPAGVSTAAIMPHMPAAGHDPGDGPSFGFFTLLGLLGLGKIPLSLALMVLVLSWGVVGFAFNALLMNSFGAAAWIPMVSLPVTFILSCIITGLCAALIGKIIPNDDGKRQRRQDLVGKSGEAIYDIDSTFGMASVRGDAGDRFQVACRTAAGKSRILKGARVVLFDYDRDKGVFHVAPFDA